MGVAGENVGLERRIQAVREKAMCVIWKQEAKAGISGNYINRSSMVRIHRYGISILHIH